MPINTRALYTPRFLSKALADAPKDYIAAALFPPLTQITQGGYVANVDKNRELLRQRNLRTANGSVPNTVVIEVDQSLTYFASKYAIIRSIPDEDFAAAEEPATIALRGAAQAAGIYMLQRENRLAAEIAASWVGGAYTGTPSTKWDVVASGTPIADITAKISLIQSRCGYRPTILGSDVQVIDAVYNVDEVQENIRYTQTISSQPGDPGARAALLAGRLGLRRWAVASNANNNTAGYGASPTLSAVWSDNVFLGNNDVNDVQGAVPAAGIHATWNGTDVGGIVDGLRIEEYRNEDVGGYSYKCTGYEKALTLDINRGFWFTNTLT